MAIRIVTDSCADLPNSVADSCSIAVAPLYVAFGEQTYRDGVDIDTDGFYALLEGVERPPTTSQLSVADFQELYRGLLDQSHHVVSIHVSSKLSGTLNSARQARESLGAESRIEVIDSRHSGGAQGLLCISAARCAEGASDHREVARRVEESIARTHGFAALDSLEQLQQGGRAGEAQAVPESALSFKPILGTRDGEAYLVGRVQGRRRALDRLATMVHELAPIHLLHLSYTTGEDHARALGDRLAGLVAPENLIESRLGPALAAHLGPNAITVAAMQRPAE